MNIQTENFDELAAYLKARRLRKILGFALFFCTLVMGLNGGNIFYEYTQALDAGLVEAELHRSASSEIYQPLFAAFQKEPVEVIRKTVEKPTPPIKTLEIPSVPKPNPKNKFGGYFHMNNVANTKVLDAEIEKLKEFENSALIFDVKGSFVYFSADSEIGEKYGLIKPLYELDEVVAKLKSAGIYTIARVISLKDDVFMTQNPAVRLWNKSKTNYVPEWVDPANQEVFDYNRGIISQILDSGIDEINLDFVRYSEKFSSEFLGITPEEKIQNVTNFVKMVRETVDSKRPETILSIDTFAILAWSFEENVNSLGQDVVALAEYVDIIAPMLYPSTFSPDNGNYFLEGKSFEYSTVYKTLQKYAELLGEEDAVKLRPWIQGYYMTRKNMTDQISAVYDAGFCGFTIWDIKNNYTATYEILENVEIPESCK